MPATPAVTAMRGRMPASDRQHHQRRDEDREQCQDHSVTGAGRDSLTR